MDIQRGVVNYLVYKMRPCKEAGAVAGFNYRLEIKDFPEVRDALGIGLQWLIMRSNLCVCG